MSTGIIGVVVEMWKPIPGAEGWYSASTYGRVRSEPTATTTSGRQRGRILGTTLDRKGYPRLRICVPDQSRRTVRVHTLIAETFLGPRPEGRQVNHINGDKADNRPCNLEYVTCGENIRHCWANGLHRDHRGENGPTAKLTEADVRAIRSTHLTESLGQIATRYGITKQNVWMIVKRKTWGHIP